jgi:hypothetical protein
MPWRLVVIGGLAGATPLTLLVLPAFYVTRQLPRFAGQIREDQAGKTVGIMLSGLCSRDYLVDDDLGHGITHLAGDLQRVAHFLKC